MNTENRNQYCLQSPSSNQWAQMITDQPSHRLNTLSSEDLDDLLFEYEMKRNRLILRNISVPVLDIIISSPSGEILDSYRLDDARYAQINLDKYENKNISIKMEAGLKTPKFIKYSKVS